MNSPIPKIDESVYIQPSFNTPPARVSVVDRQSGKILWAGPWEQLLFALREQAQDELFEELEKLAKEQ